MLHLTEMTIQGLAELLQTGKVSVTELVRTYLNELEKTAAQGNYITITDAEALARAQELDRSELAGSETSFLAGIPMSMSDNLCTRGVLTTCASRILANFIPPYSATVYERLLGAGSVLLGKNNMNEFGLTGARPALAGGGDNLQASALSGEEVNGAAAAVAENQAVFALSVDTAGCIRRAAAAYGVVGLKPTYGQVSRYGLISTAPSLEQVGCLTKDVCDSAIVFTAITGSDPFDATTANSQSGVTLADLQEKCGPLKVGLPREYLSNGLAEGVKNGVERAVAALQELGCEVEETSLPHLQYAPYAALLVRAVEASSELSNFDGVRFGLREEAEGLHEMYRKTRSRWLGPEVRRFIILGTLAASKNYYDSLYLKAQKVRTLVCGDFQAALGKYDLLLGPVANTGNPVAGQDASSGLGGEDIFTCPANMAGLPALALPWGQVENMPFAIQLIGRPYGEKALLQAAYALEQWNR